MPMIGFDFFAQSSFSSDLPPVTGIYDLNITEAVYDEVYVRSKTDSTVDTTSTKDDWLPDTLLDAKFEGTLEGGNINNAGITITQMQINRRIAGSTDNISVATLPFVNNSTVNFTDATAPTGDYVYQVIPVGSNGLQGIPIEVSATSDFYGWWIVDKDTMNTFQFNLTIDNDPHNMITYGSVPIALNQGRIQINTMSKYPQVYYSDAQYHTFDLNTIVIPSVDYTWTDWNNLVNMITQRKPLIIKAGSGDIYVCDVYAPQKTSLLNAYKNTDYMQVQVSAMEIMDYDSFMAGLSPSSTQ